MTGPASGEPLAGHLISDYYGKCLRLQMPHVIHGLMQYSNDGNTAHNQDY